MTSARHALVAMLAMGPGTAPNLGPVKNATFHGAMFGVHVECKLYERAHPEVSWADVALSGGPFGRRLVSGRAWYEGDYVAGGAHDVRRICLDPSLQKTLRRYRIKLVDVYPAPTDGSALLLHIEMPMFGIQRMTLKRVSPEHQELSEHRDLRW